MTADLTDIDAALLNDFQRDVPVVARPFAAIGAQVGIGEDEVVARLRALAERSAISRFGATCRPNTAGASTLAAVAAPDWGVERTAEIINAQTGVNHSYLREHTWNIWFVATGPDRDHVDRVLHAIEAQTGLRVLDLPLIVPFNIDLGFDLSGRRAARPPRRRTAPPGPLDAQDRRLMQALSSGLPLTSRPFAGLTEACGLDEAAALDRTARLIDEGYVTRFGVIVRHRALGWRANAMVVWELPPDRAAEVGPDLAAVPGVTLCYQRRAVPGVWPYTLYCMIHGRSRDEAMAVLDDARALPGLRGVAHDILFSLRCFRQTGALIDPTAKAQP
ncbi:Lrp/AsnC family transcriptional regulator [Rhodobacteraceae bacterium CCMM004]|nr:Lrp/AsnC family transcriptional regulator [Rhodobacteraceae bacterium CCMM004]